MSKPRRSNCGLAAALLALLALAAPLAAQQATTGQAPVAGSQQPSEAESLFAEGLRHHQGDGVPQNFATAAALFARAAEMGHPGAQNLLGRYFHAGFGVDKDQEQALRWLAAAAQSGDPQFLHDLAQALENGADGSSDPARAADFYAEAAEAGNPRAQNNLGLLYVRGNGVPQDYARAAELFAQAAEQGMAEAMTNLGVMYENGFGVPLDEARAAELYRMGGQTGRSDGAETALSAVTYDPRLAPPPQEKEALEALTAQAQAGDPVALFQLGWLLASPEDAPFPALAQAALLFRAASDKGHGPSMVNLGLMHMTGRGVLQDFVAGQMWLTLAEAAGQKGAADLGLRFADVMTPQQINQAQALAAARLGQ